MTGRKICHPTILENLRRDRAPMLQRTPLARKSHRNEVLRSWSGKAVRFPGNGNPRPERRIFIPRINAQLCDVGDFAEADSDTL